MITLRGSWESFTRSLGGHDQQLKFDPGKPGLYHYVYQNGNDHSRIHLRMDPDHNALIFINANQVLHLNPSAAFMARLYLEQVENRSAIKAIQKSFRVSRSQAENDYAILSSQLVELIQPEGSCPIHDLNLEIRPPFSAKPNAPYRMDLAITYRCNNDCAHCYNGRPRQYPELSTSDWKLIIDRIWQLGIPHVVFTGGEPTLREDLTEMIAYAQNIGLITGLNSNGRRMSNRAFVDKLVEAGLDHVQITLESHDSAIHDAMVSSPGAWKQTVRGIQNALDSSLFVMTNTTMLQENSPWIPETLDYLAELGIPTVGLNALIYSGRGKVVGTGLPEKDLQPLLSIARDKTDHHNQRLIWYTPTEYCHFDPMQLELGVKGCTAALYNMCIEPDGSVLPCQSYYQALGNFLMDPWEKIWEHPLSTSLRNRAYVGPKCSGCALLSECGGGCPLYSHQPNEQIITL